MCAYAWGVCKCAFAINSALFRKPPTASFAHTPAERAGAQINSNQMTTCRGEPLSQVSGWVRRVTARARMFTRQFLVTLRNLYSLLRSHTAAMYVCGKTDRNWGQSTSVGTVYTVYTSAHWATEPLHPFLFSYVQDASVVTHHWAFYIRPRRRFLLRIFDLGIRSSCQQATIWQSPTWLALWKLKNKESRWKMADESWSELF